MTSIEIVDFASLEVQSLSEPIKDIDIAELESSESVEMNNIMGCCGGCSCCCACVGNPLDYFC